VSSTTPSGDLLVSGLSVELDGRVILDGVDISVAKGAWLGLVGPNGAGKTTLLSSLTGLVSSQGSISLGGIPLEGLSVRRRAQIIASVPQQPVIPSEMTVGDYILLGRTPHIDYLGSETRNDYAAARAAVAALELIGFEHRRLGTLSGGEAQRAILARALAQEAPLLLLDEPTTSLDIGAQQSVLELVESLRQSRALTVISSLHDLTLAAQFCDELLVLDRGRAVLRGRSTEVLTEATVSAYFGAEVDILRHNGRITAVIPIRRSTSNNQMMSGVGCSTSENPNDSSMSEDQMAPAGETGDEVLDPVPEVGD
jgi:iron complex transport system ATP-binding protein